MRLFVKLSWVKVCKTDTFKLKKTSKYHSILYISNISTQPTTQAYFGGSCYCMTVGMTVKKRHVPSGAANAQHGWF